MPGAIIVIQSTSNEVISAKIIISAVSQSRKSIIMYSTNLELETNESFYDRDEVAAGIVD